MITAATTPQLRLPGQAAAPEGPIDVSTMYFMHFGFRRDLDAFVAAARTPVADRARWRALRGRWAKFALVLQHHHTVEDEALWPVLVERARAVGDADAVATLDAMEAEHSEIDPMLEGCTVDLDRLAETADEDARSAFEVRVVAFRERLGRHLAHEETDAMALVQRYLSAEDWKATEKAANKRSTGEYVRFVLPWGRHQLPPEGLDWARRMTPTGTYLVVRVLEPLLRPSFRRLETAAFGESS
jgi:hypothetical protein